MSFIATVLLASELVSYLGEKTSPTNRIIILSRGE